MASTSRNSGSMYTSTIIDIIFKQSNNLWEQKCEADERIDSWARTLHFQIDEHVKEQKELLTDYFNDRQRFLNEKKDELIIRAQTFDQQGQHSQITELLEYCKHLRFELLVEFYYEDRPFSFIQCTTKEQLDESSATTTVNTTFKASSSSDNNENIEKNGDLQTNSSYYPISTNGQPNNRPSSAVKPSNVYHRSISVNVGLNSQSTGHGGLEDKCPICFMIFPLSMNKLARIQHTQAHFRED